MSVTQVPVAKHRQTASGAEIKRLRVVLEEVHNTSKEALAHAKAAAEAANFAAVNAAVAQEANNKTVAEVASIEIQLKSHDKLDSHRFEELAAWRRTTDETLIAVKTIFKNVEKFTRFITFLLIAIATAVVGTSVQSLFQHWHLIK